MIKAGGYIQPSLQFGFGFDTRGYARESQGISGATPSDGFFFIADKTVLDVPLKLYFGAGVGIPDIVTVGIDIYFLWDNALSLKDPNGDDKVHLDEFDGLKISGSLSVGAEVDVQILIFHKYIDVWHPQVLFSYGAEDQARPSLAGVDDGVLRLDAPTAAFLRDTAARLIGRPLTDERVADLLGRAGPSPGPRRPALRLRLARALVASPEHRARLAHDLYLATLRREPGAAAIASLQAGGSSRALRATLLGSDEYFRNLGGGTHTSFVAAVYRDVLHREPTSDKARRWSRLLVGGASRRSMAARLLVRPEARTAEVDRLYRRLLGRPARPAELAAWVARPDLGPGALAVALLSSSEYLRQDR